MTSALSLPSLRRISVSILGLSLSLGLFCSLAIHQAQASSLTPAQVSALVSLLESFNVDPATIANVELALNGQSQPGSAGCVFNECGGGEYTISGAFNGSTIVVGANSTRFAGAIDSVTWNGVQFINTTDHGRELQSAVQLDGGGEADNPTEAGSAADGAGLRSTSVLQSISTSGAMLQTKAQMAYWQPFGGQPLSDTVLSKQVTVGFQNIPNVIEDDITFTLAEAHSGASFEGLTGYMPSKFTSYYTYDPSTQTLSPISNPATLSEVSLPVVVATPGGQYAMGSYAPDAAASGYHYAYWLFPGNTSKWDCDVAHMGALAAGDYSFHCYVAVGSLSDVESALTKVYTYFKSGGIILTASPTSGQAPLSVGFTLSGLTPANSYTLNFGDGTSQPISCQGSAPCSASASHTYASAGTYDAVLSPACTGTACSSVVLGSAVITVSGTTLSAPVISSFAASPASIAAGQSTTLSWSVSNATSLSISGIGTVTGTSVQVSPSQSTSYTLTATNAQGSNTSQTTVSVTQQGGGGGSAFTASPTTGSAPLSVTFTAAVPQGDTETYTVNFGDGSSGQMSVRSSGAGSCIVSGPCYTGVASVLHSYSASGTYTATLLNGVSAALGTATVTVTGATGGGFTAWPSSGTAPLTVYLTLTGVTSPSGYTVVFGDGQSGSSWTADNETANTFFMSHTYAAAGTYTATVGGPAGTQSYSATVTVSAGTPQGISFNASPVSGPSPLGVSFSVTGITSSSGYSVNFGDGASGALSAVYCSPSGAGIGGSTYGNGSICSYSASHTYTAAGTYTAQLLQGGSCGNSGTITCPSTVAASATVTVSAGQNGGSVGGGFSSAFDPAGMMAAAVMTPFNLAVQSLTNLFVELGIGQ